MKNFTELLLEEGFSPGFLPEETQGKFKDFNDEQLGKGGYLYEETPHTGGIIKRFVYKIWSQSAQYKTITQYPDGFSKEDLKKFEGKFTRDSFKIREQIDARHGRAAIDAQELIQNSKTPTRPPEYLQNKKLPQMHGYLVDQNNFETMHIPLYGRNGKIASVQTIYPDSSKQFLPGGKAQGSYGFFEGRNEVLYFCEGFATAASIHLATGNSVVFVLSADNYVEGIASALTRFKSPIKVIAADDDKHLKDNLGFNKAFIAAQRFNCLVKSPKFKADKGKDTTDFDDLRRESGIEAVAKQLEVTTDEKFTLAVNEGVFSLGHDDSIYYFTSTKNASVQAFQSLSKDSLFKLMPEDWWKKRYGEAGSKGDLIVKWDTVISDLYDACHAIGKFRADRIRGVGVYMDEGRTVIHLGDRLLVDGREAMLRGFQSEYTYMFDHKLRPVEAVGATDEETAVLWETLSKLNLKEVTSKYHIAGWMVCSILAGSLKWRPHLYVSGKRGSGKSTILDFMDRFLSRGFKSNHYIAIGTTATGIRQDCGAAAVPVIMDEIEGDSKKSHAKIVEFINLFRVASSNENSRSVVGTPGQKALQTMVSFCGVLGGIVPQLDTDQDRSRFAVIEFSAPSAPDEQAKQWEYLKERMAFCEREEFARRFIARIVNHAKVVLANIELLTNELMKVEQARLAQQYGALLGASLILKHTNPISEKELQFFRDLLTKKDSTISMSAEESGVDELLDQILAAEIWDEDNKKTTIRRELIKPEQSERLREIIGEYGVVIAKKHGEKGVQIRKTQKIIKQLENMPMFKANYLSVLARLPGSEKSFQAFFQGRRNRGVWLPMSAVMEESGSEKVISKEEQF